MVTHNREERCGLEQWRGIDTFKLWCCWRLLRVPWTARGSNQSILKEINSEYSLEGLLPNWSSNTLATRCKELTHWKRLMLGKVEGKRRRGWQRMRWLDSIIDSIGRNLSKLWEIVEDRGVWHAAVRGVSESPTQLSDWIRIMLKFSMVRDHF